MAKIGDLVVCTGGAGDYRGDEPIAGIVVSREDKHPGVFFFRDVRGHDCDGRAKDGHGWYTDDEDTRVVTDWKERMDILSKHMEEYEEVRKFEVLKNG